MESIYLVYVQLKTHVHNQPDVTEKHAFGDVCQQFGELKNLFKRLKPLIKDSGV